MSKERLEEIKQIRKNMQEYVNPDGSVEDYPKYDEQALLIVDDSHLDWLIEQAEQKQSLETTVDFYQSALRDADKRVQELEKSEAEWVLFQVSMNATREIIEKQNNRYREALEEIINARNHFYPTEYVFGVEGIARKALEVEK